MHHIYLSRRNLLTLLSKLDRARAGEVTACAIVKQDKDHPKYKQTIAPVMVTAVEDGEYYIDRPAGDVVQAEQERLDRIAALGRCVDSLERAGTDVAGLRWLLKDLKVL